MPQGGIQRLQHISECNAEALSYPHFEPEFKFSRKRGKLDAECLNHAGSYALARPVERRPSTWPIPLKPYLHRQAISLMPESETSACGFKDSARRAIASPNRSTRSWGGGP